MIKRRRFEYLRERHGSYASWAVWAPVGSTPKSNIGDLTILDPETNPSLLSTLHNEAVIVGLNISRGLDEPFRNFHDPSPYGQDYKIRYTFQDTPWWGAYMTDIIKGVETIDSAELQALLTPALIKSNVEAFLDELHDLGSAKPILLAFGASAHRVIADHVPRASYQHLVRLMHYSHRVGKEQYREEVLRQIGEAPRVESPTSQRS